MRLVVCALSAAVLLSGCSWGTGGVSNGWNGQSGGAYAGGYGAGGCAPTGYGQYGQANYGQGGYQGGYAATCNAGSYQVASNGYGAGYGGGHGLRGAQNVQQGYGAGAYGAGAYGAGGYGAGAAGTVLGASAPYGSAAGAYGAGAYGAAQGAQFAAGGAQYATQTIQGAPIYVPQPYPAYYGGGACCGGGLRGGAAALPFGIEAGIGTELEIGGDIFGGEKAKPSGTNFISSLPVISYNDAYDTAVTYTGGVTYDVSPTTTVLGQLGFSKANGNHLNVGTISDGAGVTEDLYAQWGDLEQWTLEGGVRQYFGGWNNGTSGLRPYVTATGGFTHNNSVDLVQESATLAPAALNTQQYIDSGWNPTAAGLVGVEMQVGPRTAIGVETGIRWRDDLNTISPTNDRWSVPLRVRGRVSF
jgi:hypothetical protein